MALKIGFAGTPMFAARCLATLQQSPHTVAVVLTQPDRPAGRGRRLQPSPVKQYALANQLPLLQPTTLRDPAIVATLDRLALDALIVVAYGLLLPTTILTLPRFGCLNAHASLLPKWRGAAPMQHAILQGDGKTGITIMAMDAGLDTGDMLRQVSCPIDADMTTGQLHDRLAPLASLALCQTLSNLEAGKTQPQPQDNNAASYAPKITKAQACIDWTQPATTLARQVRAYHPWPVSFTYPTDTPEQPWRIHQAQALDSHTDALPGTCLALSATHLEVAAGQGSILAIQILQRPGGKPTSITDWQQGHTHLPKAFRTMVSNGVMSNGVKS